MPQVKCTRCRIRLHRAKSGADPTGGLCPECGALLEPAASASEVLGVRKALPIIADPVDETPADGQQWLADHVVSVAVTLPRSDTPSGSGGAP
jgi:hypothetical protein